jgi:hydrogenase small subunit
MSLTRQDLLMASAAVAAAFGLQGAEALAQESGYSVIWLRAESCTGCSASLLETICYDSIDCLLEHQLDLDFESSLQARSFDAPNPMAWGGRTSEKSVLVVEGAVPIGPGNQCYLWPGLTAANGINIFASRTSHVIAVGACALRTNSGVRKPGQVVSVQTLLGPSREVINLPGCPIDPDWLIGTIAYLFKHGAAPALDSAGRPTVTPGRGVSPLPHLNRPEIWHRTVA